MSKHVVDIKCPYCGEEFKKQFNFEESKNKYFITCDSEIGGCDGLFAVFLKKFIEHKAYKLVLEKDKA